MELVEEEHEGAIVVRVRSQRIDASRAPLVKETVTRSLEAEPRRIILDLSLVEFIDSIGLGVLVACFKRAGGQGKLAIVGARGAVARLFQLTRMDRVFPLYASLDDALKT